MTSALTRAGGRSADADGTTSPDVNRLPVRTSVALAVAAVVAAVATLVPGVLHGTAVMNGSARGTAWVVLLLGVPTLLVGAGWTLRGRWLGPPLWLGATGLLTYNAVLLVLATPVNRAYLAYEATLGLAIATLVLLLPALAPVRDAYRPVGRARLAAVWIGFVAVANLALWLARVLPATVSDGPGYLDGTGLTTNPVFDQDLAFWLPLALVVAWWLWRDRPWGGLLAAGLLVFWVLEAVTVAVDQWLGSSAAPDSTVATRGASYLFAGMTVAGLLVLVGYLRALRPHPDSSAT